MSPRVTFIFSLVGILLVGIPLPLLTRTAETTSGKKPGTEEIVCRPVYANLRFTGQVQAFRLRHGNGDWIDVGAEGSNYDFELELPLSGRIEIEVDAQWDSPVPQAVTLTLEADGYASRSETQWKDQGSDTLHSIFTFTW